VPSVGPNRFFYDSGARAIVQSAEHPQKTIGAQKTPLVIQLHANCQNRPYVILNGDRFGGQPFQFDSNLLQHPKRSLSGSMRRPQVSRLNAAMLFGP